MTNLTLQTRGIAKGRLMARRPPTDGELRERIRRWVKHYWRLAEAKDVNRQEFAESLDLSPPTISNILNNQEVPGLDTLVRLHFYLGADLREMIREDPPRSESDRPESVAPKR